MWYSQPITETQNEMNNDDTSSRYQTLPEFTTYLWFLTQWSEFQTPFHVSLLFSDNHQEQDALRPIFQEMAEQFFANKQNNTVLTHEAFWAWYTLNEHVRRVRKKYTMAA